LASLNPSDIITTLKSGNYPYELQFYERRQRFVIYPSVEVVKTKPDSRTATDPTKYTVSSSFEIKLYIKFTRSPNAEETDRAKIENEMLRVLEEADTEPKGKIFHESFDWSRSALDQEIFGSISTLRFEYKDVIPINDGIVSAYDKLELNSDSTTPTQVQILTYQVIGEGADVEKHQDDELITYYDPSTKRELEFQITYESTNAMDNVINTASKGRGEIKGRLFRGTATSKYNLLVGNTTKIGQYGDTEKSTTSFSVTGDWSKSQNNVHEEQIITETTIAKLTSQ
tara:strand:+ start:4557 stop:5411 length:855 start_codon:yes stop_codon:yes gene_type:complete